MKIYKLVLFCNLLLGCSSILSAQIRAKEGKGYFNITNIAELNYLQSADSSKLTYASGYVKSLGYSLSTINGVFLNSNLSLGLGVGLQFASYKAHPTSYTPDSSYAKGYFEDAHNMTLLPVFADFRYYPKGVKRGLMFLLNVGYVPLLKIDHEFDRTSFESGALVKLGAAYRISLSETISFVPALNFNMQRIGTNTSIGANVGVGFMF